MLKKIFLPLITLINIPPIYPETRVTALDIEKLRQINDEKNRFLEYIKMDKKKIGDKYFYYGSNTEIGDEAVFKTDLALSDLTVNKADVRGAIFQKGFFCTNAKFKGKTLWNQCVFYGYLKFEGATFYNDANFSETTIEKNANFVLTNFKKKALFNKAYFKGKSYWHKTSFFSSADFENTTFKEKNDFLCAKFKWDANFKNTRFEQKSKFRFAQFDKLADFKNTIFKQQADFFGAIFNNRTNFSNSEFEQEALFRWSIFNSYVAFNSTIFLGLVNFKYSNLAAQSASFSGAKYTGNNAKYVPEKYKNQMTQIGSETATELYSY